MPTTTFTIEQLKKYFSDKYFHKTYKETCELADALLVHADGIYPKKQIEERRPSESLSVKAYREKIWKPVTKQVIGRVLTSLNKIRRSADWSVRFDPSKVPASIAEGESLADFCEKNFPQFGTLTNWVFNVLLRFYTTDANGVTCIMPLGQDVQANEYVKPFPYIVYSRQIIEYKEADHLVFKSTDKVEYGTEVKYWGDVYYVVTTQTVQRYEQIKSDRTMRLAWEYVHAIGELPVIKNKGRFKRSMDNDSIYESRLADMVPRLDEALREYSDLQAEVVQHIFSEKWEFISDDCPECTGRGTVDGDYGKQVECRKCAGTGGKPRGPYTTLQLRAPMAGENPPPTPPIGYVQKDTGIVDIQDKRIDKHIYTALAAVNMQFLDQTPLSISGDAKEVDRDELSVFVHSIAEDLVAIMDRVVYFIAQYRYMVVVPDTITRLAMLPSITVPEKFDLMSATYLETQLKSAKDNGIPAVIINSMVKEYVNKRFASDTSVRDEMALTLELDPLAGISEDDRMSMLSNDGITHEDYIVSCNISNFIKRAVDEKGPGFFDLDNKQKRELLLQYAAEIKKKMSVSETVVSQFPPETAPADQGAPNNNPV